MYAWVLQQRRAAEPKSVQNGAYGKGSNPYFKKMKTWREADNLPGLEVT